MKVSHTEEVADETLAAKAGAQTLFAPVVDSESTTGQMDTSLSPEMEEQSRRFIDLIVTEKARQNSLWPLVTLSGLFLTLCGMLFVTMKSPYTNWYLVDFGVCCIGGSLLYLGIKHTIKPGNGTEIMRILACTEDPRLIPYIIDLNSRQMSSINLILRRQALLRLLPKLSAREAQRLRSQHWQSLHYQLCYNDVPLIIAILELIERCGSIGSLRYVSPLAEGKLSAKHNARIRELAQACQTKLQARLDNQSAPQILLRGSAAPTGDTLLRPSIESAPTAPQQLLRAAGENERAD